MPHLPIPSPAHVDSREDSLTVGPDTTVVAFAPALAGVAQRFVDDVALDCGIQLRITDGTPALPAAAAIVLELDSAGLDAVAVASGVRADGRSVFDRGDERHGVEISSAGIRVWGATIEAVHRGLTSLRQLIATQADAGSAELTATSMLDGPRFAWRGLSLDVVRTFHGPETVRRVLDMCSLYKVNVLHLHLSDDQGWRIEVPSRPALTEVGGAGAMGDRPGGFYSLTDMAELVAYAAERHVTIVPEIDMPGHTTAIFRAYPALTPSDAASLGGLNGFDMPVGNLEPGNPATWQFVEDVLHAVIPQFPQSAFVHIGGDEAFGMPDAEHAAFVERAIALVRAHGKRAIGWQEIARAAIDADDVVQYWMEAQGAGSDMDLDQIKTMLPPEVVPLILEALNKAEHDLPTALARGSKVVISPTRRLYFDRPHAAESTDPAQEGRRARVGLPFYPATTLRDGVEWDPIDDTPGLTGDDQAAGLEAAVWCETVTDQDDLEFLLLPRLAGLAEKAWSRRGGTDWDEYAGRLSSQSPVWDARGWNWFRSSEVSWASAELIAR